MKGIFAAALLALGLSPALGAAPGTDEVAAIARSAFVYGYPMVDVYKVLYHHALDPQSPEYKAPLNTISHMRHVASPDDKAIVAPNVDTPYSYAWLDLRAEPMVLSMPASGEDRYVSLQLIDAYTHIIGYVTPRTQGRGGGDFLIAGPDWQGETPAGIRHVFRSPTQLVLAFYRTELLGPDDLGRVHALQDRYRLQSLSAFLGKPSPPAAATLQPVPLLDVRKQPTSLQFFTILNWMLQTMPVLPEERALRERLATIGIVAGQPFHPADPAQEATIVRGMADGLADLRERIGRIKSSAELFGSRDFLKDDYLTRATAAMVGIFGNAAEEFSGVGYRADAAGRPFDGHHSYRIRFAPGSLPPVDAFWSITAYTSDQLLYANALKRHKIGSSMLPDLKRDADGGITIHIQHQPPGTDQAANWLPVPAAPFGLTFRTYLPRLPIRTGQWQAPPVERLTD